MEYVSQSVLDHLPFDLEFDVDRSASFGYRRFRSQALDGSVRKGGVISEGVALVADMACGPQV